MEVAFLPFDKDISKENMYGVETFKVNLALILSTSNIQKIHQKDNVFSTFSCLYFPPKSQMKKQFKIEEM